MSSWQVTSQHFGTPKMYIMYPPGNGLMSPTIAGSFELMMFLFLRWDILVSCYIYKPSPKTYHRSWQSDLPKTCQNKSPPSFQGTYVVSALRCFHFTGKILQFPRYVTLPYIAIICAMVKSRYIGDGHPTFNRNPYNGYINPYYWVDDHPLLYGSMGV